MRRKGDDAGQAIYHVVLNGKLEENLSASRYDLILGADPAASGDCIPKSVHDTRLEAKRLYPEKCTMCAILTSTNGQDVSESPKNEIFSAHLKNLL